jgi:hypothetical protein
MKISPKGSLLEMQIAVSNHIIYTDIDIANNHIRIGIYNPAAKYLFLTKNVCLSIPIETHVFKQCFKVFQLNRMSE